MPVLAGQNQRVKRLADRTVGVDLRLGQVLDPSSGLPQSSARPLFTRTGVRSTPKQVRSVRVERHEMERAPLVSPRHVLRTIRSDGLRGRRSTRYPDARVSYAR